MSNLDKRDELAQAIAGITDQLMDIPMPDGARAILVADRKHLRQQLADLEAPTLASLGLSEWEVPSATR